MKGILEKPITAMVSRIMALTKVHAQEKDVKELLDRMKDYINYFNSSIDPYTKRILGQDLSDIIVLNEFKDFIIPASVKMNAADLMCTEMLIYPELSADIDSMSYMEYLNICIQFRSLFKDDLSANYVKLDELKKSVSWADVSSRCSYEVVDGDEVYRVTRMTDSVPFVPLPVKNFIMEGWNMLYFNVTQEEVLEKYLETWLITK